MCYIGGIVYQIHSIYQIQIISCKNKCIYFGLKRTLCLDYFTEQIRVNIINIINIISKYDGNYLLETWLSFLIIDNKQITILISFLIIDNKRNYQNLGNRSQLSRGLNKVNHKSSSQNGVKTSH